MRLLGFVTLTMRTDWISSHHPDTPDDVSTQQIDDCYNIIFQYHK